jgi:hypothetical protein
LWAIFQPRMCYFSPLLEQVQHDCISAVMWYADRRYFAIQR